MFAIRKEKPKKGNKHFTRVASGGYNTCIKGKPTDDCDALANCVGYAQGRFNEIYAELTGYKGNKYSTLNCNAENFIERAKAAGLKTGTTPKPGAIMCWQKGKSLKSSDGAGHVAIVEKVNSASSVYTSESGYGSKAFWNATRTNSNGRWGSNSNYTFRGFIYNPAVKDEEINPYTEPTTTVKKGCKGEGVKWVQWWLQKKGYDIGSSKIDGSCGSDTDKAIRAFQKDKKLEVDGKVGAKTKKALKGE